MLSTENRFFLKHIFISWMNQTFVKYGFTRKFLK